MSHAGYMAGPERRRQILDGAKRIFAARGYHATNISHICDDLGIGRGTLYQYFKGKKEVFTAVIEDMLERLRAEIDGRKPLPIPYAPVPEEQVVQWSQARLHKILSIVFQDEESLRILLREAVGLDIEIDAIVAAVDEIVIEACAADVRAAQSGGLVRADVDPHRVALLMVGGIEKLAMAELTAGGPIDLEQMARTVSRMHLLGILARQGSR